MEHTPKNILIRGVKSRGLLPKAARKQQMENYQKCRDFFGAELTLEKLFKEMEGRWRMSRTKKILLTLLAYLTAFIAAVCVSSFVLNQGKVSGEQQRSSADLPLLYVRTGGELMNEMHGYTER